MTQHYVQNAESIVSSFKELLSEEQAEILGEENFSQLTMLIEAGIANLLLLNMEKVADKIEDLAHAVRNDAEHFEDN